MGNSLVAVMKANARHTLPQCVVATENYSIVTMMICWMGIAGGPSHQLRASEQEIMSPTKEDTPVMPGAHPGNLPLHNPLPPDQAPLPAYEAPQGGLLLPRCYVCYARRVA